MMQFRSTNALNRCIQKGGVKQRALQRQVNTRFCD